MHLFSMIIQVNTAALHGQRFRDKRRSGFGMGSWRAKKGTPQTANGILSSQRQVHAGVTVFLSFLPEAQPRTKRQPKRWTTGQPDRRTARQRYGQGSSRRGNDPGFSGNASVAPTVGTSSPSGWCPWRDRQWERSAPPTTRQLSLPLAGRNLWQYENHTPHNRQRYPWCSARFLPGAAVCRRAAPGRLDGIC